MDILKYIYQIPLFQLVDLSILMNLNIPSRAFAKKIKKNAIIYLKGEKCSSLDAIVTGIVFVVCGVRFPTWLLRLGWRRRFVRLVQLVNIRGVDASI